MKLIDKMTESEFFANENSARNKFDFSDKIDPYA